MKILLLLALTIGLSAWQLEAYPNEVTTRGLNDRLIELIEHLKTVMKKGNETLGVPILDPLSIKYREFPLASGLFSGDVKLKSCTLTGLSNFEIKKAELSMVGLKLSLKLSWPKLEGSTKLYNVKGIAANILNIYGTGYLKFNLEDLLLTTTISISAKRREKTLFIKEIDTEVSLGDLQVSIDGLFNNKDLSDVISAIASDLGPSFVKTYQYKLTKAINSVFVAQVNEVLGTMTLKDILALIKG